MLRSLYAKLSLGLLFLFVIVGLFAIGMTVYTTRLYQQEVNQKLNRDLAKNIVAEKRLIHGDLVDQEALKDIFHMLMVINPSIELYLLGPDGKILAYSADPGKVKRTYIALAPLEQWLRGEPRLPVLGDDPRDTGRGKPFSAARINGENGMEGYLYIILGGEDYEGVAQMLADSYIINASVWVMFGGMMLATLGGLVLFAMLTGRLQRLTQAMTNFKLGELPNPLPGSGQGDEIDRLTAVFRDMALTIAEQTRKLERSDQLRRELVADVSHDLRTPLATLQGYVETLLIKNSELSDTERKKYLEIAIKHCHHLNKLVGELLELARLDALEMQLKRESFSMPELVQDIVQKFRLKAESKGIKVEVEVPENLPFVLADIALIERALENLIENALRYTPESGKIVMRLNRREQGVVVEVEDTGCGIPESDLSRIFDRFYQSDKSRNLSPGTSGLGLSIAKRILELHGGSIDVRSALQKGTTFSFCLPGVS